MLSQIKKIISVSHSLFREHLEKRVLRSDKWPTVRKNWLKENSSCAACSSTKFLQVHHVEAFHEDPSKELDPTNFITLCAIKECHLKIGHGGSYKTINPNSRQDAALALSDPSNFENICLSSKKSAIPNIPINK